MRHVAAVLAALLVLSLAAPLWGQDRAFRPIIIYQGDIDSSSYNRAVHEGVMRFVEKTGSPCEEIVLGGDGPEYRDALELAAKQGYNPVVIIYGNHIEELSTLIHAFPQTRFIAFSARIDQPNIFSLDFAEHEGAFLAGALAAMVSKTKVVGFISVADQPLMRRFACGFEQGAKYVDPDIAVLVDFLGRYKDAWFDEAGAARLADSLMDKGADVIFQAAGGAGAGVIDACAKRNRFAIGVDINQNGRRPGFVLASMVKKADQVVYAVLLHAKRGIWRDNIKTFGLAQDAVGLAFDENTPAVVTQNIRKRLDQIKSGIVLGKIPVHDFIRNNACPR